MLESIKMMFGLWARMGPSNHVLQITHENGQFWGKGAPIVHIGNGCHERCKNDWTDRDAVWTVDSGGPKEARLHELHGRHIGTTWWIRLNRPCAAAMQPYAKLLWLLVCLVQWCHSAVLSQKIVNASMTSEWWRLLLTSTLTRQLHSVPEKNSHCVFLVS